MPFTIAILYLCLLFHGIAPPPPFPSVHERQGHDVYCFMWNTNNIVQKQILNPEITRKLTILIEKKVPPLSGKLIDWKTDADGNKNKKQLGIMFGGSNTNMFEEIIPFCGFEYHRSQSKDLLKYVKGTAGADNYTTHLFSAGSGGQPISQARALQIMQGANFQAWHIHLHYYGEDDGDYHEVTITHNGNDWWYLDPAFPLIDPTANLISYGCTNYHGYTDMHGPPRFLRAHPDNEETWKEMDCFRLEKYGATLIRYLGSRYLGNGVHGRAAAIDRIKQMFVGIDIIDPDDSPNTLHNQFKLSFVLAVEERVGEDKLKWFAKRFDKNIMSNDFKSKYNGWLKKQKKLIPDDILDAQKTRYVRLYGLKKGFWVNTVNGKGSNEANLKADKKRGYTCRVNDADPSGWNREDVRTAWMAEWRRWQEKCTAKFKKSETMLYIPMDRYVDNKGWYNNLDILLESVLLGEILIVLACVCCGGCIGFAVMTIYCKFKAYNKYPEMNDSPL